MNRDVFLAALGSAALVQVIASSNNPIRQLLDKRIVEFRTPFHRKKEMLDGWSITHFLLHAYFGYKEPDQFFKFLALGIGYEIIEDFMASTSDTKLVKCEECEECKKNPLNKIWCNPNNGNTYYAKVTDIITNSLGFAFGRYLATR
jgi:hypothetical protein